ncbi:helix-turn-helix transcriptional regulator [Glycomyces fuscus]|nr:helix-turn-helix transcriptional regulator [Glycomyces fuscus]
MTSTHEHVDQLPVPYVPESGPPLIPMCDRKHQTMVVGPDSPNTEATLLALRSMDCTAGVLTHFDCPAEAIAHLGERRWDFVFHVRFGTEDTEALRDAARGAQGKHLSVLPASARSSTCLLDGTGTDAMVSVDDLSPADLHFAFWQLDLGRVYLSPGLVDQVAAHGRRLRDVPGPATRLTERERQTLALMARGLENKEIAAHLQISLHGAKRNVAQVLTKLDCTNRTMAVVKAMGETVCGLGRLAREY